MTLMILPTVLFVFVFAYLPMGGIILAFKDYTYTDGIFGSAWVGFDNFRFFFLSGSAMRVTFNTVAYNVVFIIVNIVFQVAVAIILSEIIGKYFKKVITTMIFMPYFISWVVAGAVVFNVLDYNVGLLNTALKQVGINPVDVFNSPGYWPYILVAFRIWKDLGFGVVIYMATLTGIDQEMYDSASIDGANIFQKVLNISLPYLRPTIVILVLLGLGNIIRGDFAMFYNLTGNSAMLRDVTDIIDVVVYRSLQTGSTFGMAAAIGVYQSVLGFIIVVTVNYMIKKAQPDYALF